MATWDDVRRLAMAMPEVAEGTGWGSAQWKVGGKLFVWERPLRKKDLTDLGLEEQPGPVLGARVPDEGAKEAMAADAPELFFTTPHFDGYPSILVWLDHIDVEELTEVVTEAWLARAPVTVRRAWLAGQDAAGPT